LEFWTGSGADAAEAAGAAAAGASGVARSTGSPGADAGAEIGADAGADGAAAEAGASWAAGACGATGFLGFAAAGLPDGAACAAGRLADEAGWAGGTVWAWAAQLRARAVGIHQERRTKAGMKKLLN
jgi:hypothetical protein